MDWKKAKPEEVEEQVKKDPSKIAWKDLPEETLGKLSHSTLLDARKYDEKDKEYQAKTSYYEYVANMREDVVNNPLNAIGGLINIPAWSVVKVLGKAITESRKFLGDEDAVYPHRSNPSIDQHMAGYQGIGEGLAEVAKPWLMFAKEKVEEMKPWEMFKKEE